MPDELETTDISEGMSDRDILNGAFGDDESQEEETDEEGQEEPKGKAKGKRAVSEDDGDSEGSGDDDDEEEVDEEEGSEEEEEEEDSEEDDDESDESDDEEADELDSNLIKGLLKKNPKIFKEFPQLRDVIQREEEFSKVFATTEDAAEADNRSKLLNAMYLDIVSGDIEKTGRFIKSIESTNKEGYEEFAHTFLDAVGKNSPDLYGQIMLKPIKRAIQAMYASARKAGNKNLTASAIYAHEWFFETQDIKSELEDRKKAVAKPKEQEQWEKEREEILNTAASEFQSGVVEAITHSLKGTIKKSLENYKDIDDYKLRNIIRDIQTEVDSLMGQDKRHLQAIDSLFNQAKSAKFNSEWKSRIIKAYLNRAKQSLSTVRNKVLKEAGIKVTGEAKEVRRMVPAGLGGSKPAGIDFKRVDKTKTTDADILSGDPKRIKYLK